MLQLLVLLRVEGGLGVDLLLLHVVDLLDGCGWWPRCSCS